MNTNTDWRFCAVGNIKPQHTDENGKILYGTKAFAGRTKVYIDDKTWRLEDESVSVIGLNRFGRYAIERVPINLIENIRLQRIYKPIVLRVMDNVEILDGWVWRGRTVADRKEITSFVKMCNEIQL